jgi:hypothetical protein
MPHMLNRCVCFGVVCISVGQKSSIATGCGKGTLQVQGCCFLFCFFISSARGSRGPRESRKLRFSVSLAKIIRQIFCLCLLICLFLCLFRHFFLFSFLSLSFSLFIYLFISTTAGERDLENKRQTFLRISGMIYINCNNVEYDKTKETRKYARR